MVATRFGLTFIFAVGVLNEGLRNQMHYVALMLVAGLLVLIQQANQERTRRLRNLCIVDLGILVTIVPMAVLAGFVSAEPGELLPAERSAFIETSIAMVVALAITLLLGFRLFSGDRSLLGANILPAMLLVVSLSFVLHDYRNQTVLAMMAISYFAGTTAIALGVFVEEPVRRYTSAMFYVSTVLAGVLLFDPGLGNLTERAPLIQVVSSVMVVLGMLVLMMIPVLWFRPDSALAEILSGTQGRPRVIGNRRRSEGDPS